MVSQHERYLNDASFIVERIHNTFFGAPLLTIAERDYTFPFGVLRDLLRLRRSMQIHEGLVVLGKETHSLSSRDSIQSLIPYLDELGIPCAHDDHKRTIDLARSICADFSHIITGNLDLLQFCTETLTVVFPRRGKEGEWDWMSPGMVRDMMGISPAQIPTYMALTDPASLVGVTNRQAARIIEMFGNLDGIYRNLDRIVPVHLRSRLAQRKREVRLAYTQRKSRRARTSFLRTIPTSLTDLDTSANRRRLKQYGFASLCGFLTISEGKQRKSPTNKRDFLSYHAVV